MFTPRPICRPCMLVVVSVLCVVSSACNLSSSIDVGFEADETQDQRQDARGDQGQVFLDQRVDGSADVEPDLFDDTSDDVMQDMVTDHMTHTSDVQEDLSIVCGDGVIDAPEACDDGNSSDGDGCDAECALEAGFVCQGTPSTCVLLCGNGVVDAAEACDDSNVVNGDGCDDTCAIEPGYSCPSNAPCVPVCGDGVLVANEQCDDSNTISNDGCSAICQPEPGFQCAGVPSMCMSVCGDGIKTSTEQCDDGNLTRDDGCDPFCALDVGYTWSGQLPLLVERIRGNPAQSVEVSWPAGAPTGTLEDARCNDGKLMTGFLSNDSTGVLPHLRISCEHVDRASNSAAYVPTGGFDQVLLGDNVGGGGTGKGCINDWVVKGISVHVNAQQEFVGFGITCGRLEVRDGQAVFDPAIAWGPRTVGASSAVTSYSLECAAGSVPVGVSGLFTTSVVPRNIGRVGLLCDVPHLEF